MTAPRGSAADSFHSSWVELHYNQSSCSSSSPQGAGRGLEHVPSSSSIHSEDMQQILLDAQLEFEKNSSLGGSHCDSPPLTMSPRQSPEPTEVETAQSGNQTSVQPQNNPPYQEQKEGCPEWVWDWASRPEHLQPKEFVFKHPQAEQLPQTQAQATLSIQKAKAPKKGSAGIFSSELLMLFIPSLLLSHLLTIGLGIYIGKRWAASSSSTL
ncbi:BCL2/adenovirus E1B 19 kDa protein-interacting protein 3-like isoform X2 [Rhinatrema bivittatum]|uniref:BCL2/adenovirus E1B 19 kDa protein-interacting protein 3-like isoform X2 n=1 Tax=Rhinatrema bivittatum TaxID=194408 RepID=UPI001128F5FE|nr:BCL2/adenovirus E1B 19 kDa protein-interacting protein 3-like isoform X2 [Rhinatrema bivittatum]